MSNTETQLEKVADQKTAKRIAVRGEPTVAQMLQSMIDSGKLSQDNVGAFEKLCELHWKQQGRDAEKEFNAAFAQLQSELPKVEAIRAVKNNDGTERYRYADFQTIMDAIQPVLTAHKFSVAFNTRIDADRLYAICTLLHVSGHSRSNEFGVRMVGGPPGTSEQQKDGSAKSYAKRGALSDALNIVVDHDDDARLIGGPVDESLADDFRQRVRQCGADERAFLKFAGVIPSDPPSSSDYLKIPRERCEELDASLKRKESRRV
jgi:hypothetical protein